MELRWSEANMASFLAIDIKRFYNSSFHQVQSFTNNSCSVEVHMQLYAIAVSTQCGIAPLRNRTINKPITPLAYVPMINECTPSCITLTLRAIIMSFFELPLHIRTTCNNVCPPKFVRTLSFALGTFYRVMFK